MKQLLNTLYITTQGAYLSRDGTSVVVNVEKKAILRVPIHTIGGIICFGNVMYSPFFLGLCGDNNVSLSHFTERGRFLARIQGPVSGNVLLRRQQYRWADDEVVRGRVSRAVVTAKIANCRTVLLRAGRENTSTERRKCLSGATRRLSGSLKALADAEAVDEIRGIEGDAAKIYFGVFDDLITNQKDAFFFHNRNRRPPLDNVNAMLSFIYTILAHDVRSALEGVGLDPAVGFLHRDRPGRPGLALDLMEELRSYLGDRIVLSLINRKQVRPSGFVKSESGAITMDDDTRKTLLITLQKRKQDELTHPFLGEKIKLGLLPHVQALLLARFIRGDVNGYAPFLWK